MADENEFDEGTDAPHTARIGDRLREAREQRGLSLKDIAKETRIPIRHLESLEKSDFAALPGKTYAIGFAKAYARTVEGDEIEASEAIRHEYEYVDSGKRTQYQAFEPADPSRVPTRFLAWTAAIVGLLLFAAYLIWRPFSDGGGDPYASTAAVDAAPGVSGQTRPPATDTPSSAVSADAPVVLTANQLVWFRIDDADGNRLHEQELAAGDSYNVPRESAGMLLRTARPQALDVTVGGIKIATLGPPDTLVSNVPLEPRALVARASAGP